MKLRSNKLHIATADAINSMVSMGWMDAFLLPLLQSSHYFVWLYMYLIQTTVNIYPDLFLKHRLLQNMYIVE